MSGGALAVVAVFAVVAFLWGCAEWEYRHNLGGLSRCCSAVKYGWYTPFGWVVRCSKCHAEW